MITALIILFILNILDITSTYHALSNGGIEANPIALWTMQWGSLGFIGFKLLGFVVTVIFVVLLSNIKSDIVNFKRASIIALTLFNLFMLYVVLNNYQIIGV